MDDQSNYAFNRLGRVVLSTEEHNKLETDNEMVLTYFMTTWCAPCKWINSDAKSYALPDEYKKEGISAAVVHADNPDTQGVLEKIANQSPEIGGVPCMVLTRNGEYLDRLTGAVAPKLVHDMVDKHYDLI